MMRQLSIFVVTLSVFLGCVSVKIAGTKAEKAQGIGFVPPEKPFAHHENASADLAWISKNTGNTIAVLSDCGNQADSSLSTLESETLSVLTNAKVITSVEKQYNGRLALFTKAEGLLDGVPMHMSFVTLKKNGCDFAVSYFGRKQFQDAEAPIYEKFLQEFKAP